MIGLMHSQGQELAGQARVNVISPGWIDTGDPKDEGHYQPTKQDKEWHAVGRLGRPSDVAELVSFLADEEKSGFITCQEFVIDGGVSRKMVYPE
jgi:NAD(P)-dependent dehydrogenase (short-subunit alcohol dehydrogenase family)